MGVVKNLMVRAGADFSELEQKMQGLSRKMSRWGKDLKKVGDGLTKSITLPAVAIGGALAGATVKAGQWADEVITASNKTGLTTEQLQELHYASRFVDVDVETMTDSMFRLTKGMDQARKGTGAQAEAFNTLGVQIVNADGSLRDSQSVWADTIDALGKVENEAERDAMAYKLFGRSAQELNPLIAAGGDELNRLQKEAHDMGVVMSQEDVKALGAFDDQMQIVQAQAEVAGKKIGLAFLPALQQLIPIIQEHLVPAIQKLTGIITGLIDRFNNMSPTGKKVALAFVAILVGIGPVLSVLGTLMTKVIPGVIKGIGLLGKGLAFLAANPVVAIIAAIALLIAGIVWLWKNNEDFRNGVIKIWNGLKAFFSGAMEGIKKLFSGAVSAIRSSWSRLKDILLHPIQTARNAIMGIINRIKDAFKNIFKVNIKLPKFSISGSLNPTRWAKEGLPKLGIRWNKDGGIFTQPTVLPTLAGMQGFGEAGAEAILPLSKLPGIISKSMDLSGSTQEVVHSGTVTVRGVNNKGELIAIVEKEFADKMARDDRRVPNRPSLVPIG